MIARRPRFAEARDFCNDGRVRLETTPRTCLTSGRRLTDSMSHYKIIPCFVIRAIREQSTLRRCLHLSALFRSSPYPGAPCRCRSACRYLRARSQIWSDVTANQLLLLCKSELMIGSCVASCRAEGSSEASSLRRTLKSIKPTWSEVANGKNRARWNRVDHLRGEELQKVRKLKAFDMLNAIIL